MQVKFSKDFEKQTASVKDKALLNRIGISLEDDTVWFLFFGKRDESTYKKFP